LKKAKRHGWEDRSDEGQRERSRRRPDWEQGPEVRKADRQAGEKVGKVEEKVDEGIDKVKDILHK
jgi:hypothetical protein